MGITQTGEKLLAWGHVALDTEGQWLVGNADRIPHPTGVHEKLRFKLWAANPGSRYDWAQGGHVRTTVERKGTHECVRVMKELLGWWPGEESHPRSYSFEQGNINLGEHDEGRWILLPECQSRAIGTTLLTPYGVPYPQDGYSPLCEQHFTAAGLTEAKNVVIKRLSWPDHPAAFIWKKMLITVFDGKLNVIDDGGAVARTLSAGGYAFFEAFSPTHDPEKDGPRPTLPLDYSLVGNLLASVLFY